MAGKVRIARKATKGKGKSWKRGYSSSSNPETKKHRENAKRGFFQYQGHTKLTAELLAKHNEDDGTSEVTGKSQEFSEELSEGDTYNTFATVFSECSNPSFDRLMKNWQASSALQKEMLAIVAAVTEVIKENGGKETESEYFAALMTTLERVETEESKAAVVTLLGMVMKRRLPASVLKLKFSDISKSLIEVLASSASDNNALLRGVIGCLCSLLKSQEKAVWNISSTLQVYNVLLTFCAHFKPKVRKAAQHAVISVLKYSVIMTQTDPPAVHPATGSTAKFCAQKLQESTGAGGITTKLHILALLQETLGLFSKNDQKNICETVLQLMSIGSPLVSCCAFKAFGGLFLNRAPKDCVNFELSAQLMNALHDYQPSANDARNTVAWLVIMNQGIFHLQKWNGSICLNHLVKMISSVSKCWLSNKQEVLDALAKTISELLAVCVKPIASALLPSEENSSLDSVHSQIQKIVSSFENCLTYQYHSAWGHLLRVISVLFEAAGKSCGIFTIKILERMADLRDSHKFGFAHEVDKAYGMAIRYFGPQLVLKAVPFNIVENGEHLDFPRSWLIPLLRDNVRSTQLCFFNQNFLPLALKLRNKADLLKKANRMVDSKTCDVLQSQIWSLLPGFCFKPTDLATSFKEIAKQLGIALGAQPDLRLSILAALRTLINHNSDNEANLAELSRFAKNYLPILFNLYTTEPKNSTESNVRLAIYETIRSYLKITSPELTELFFKKSHEKLNAAALDDFNRHSLLDLCRALLPYINAERVSSLVCLCKPLLENTEKTVQKKAYRVMEELCRSQSPDCKAFVQSNLGDLGKLFYANIAASANSSKAPRLRCLCHIVENLEKRNEEIVQTLVSEAVLCTKLTSEKARAAAFNLLINIARAEQRWTDNPEEALTQYFHMIMAGLAGNPHLVSATLLALGKLFFEFYGELSSEVTRTLMENVSLLMTSKSREIIQSALSFFKTAIVTIPHKHLEQFVPDMVGSMVQISEETQRPFRFKAKEIFTRFIRKFGFESIIKLVPESHRKVLTNIRKMEARKARKLDHRESSREGKQSSDNLDDILQDSDEDESEDKESFRVPKGKNEAWIQEGDEDDIVDFLDPSINQKVTSGKPVMAESKKNVSHSFKSAPDGRLVITEVDEDLRKRKKDLPMEDITEAVDTIDLKDERKRRLTSADATEEDDGREAGGGRGIRRKLGNPGNEDGSKYRAKKAKGDVKMKGQLDPYAYIPLNRQTLNKRKRAKFSKEFGNVVKGARKAATKGKKLGNKNVTFKA